MPTEIDAISGVAPQKVFNKRCQWTEQEAAIWIQRWWRKCIECQDELFQDVVTGLAELREEAALEIQYCWRIVRRGESLPTIGFPRLRFK
mmetsp:Transcript_86543/g.137357  ORF Transcript_86543/g.137357 Transcript_86543/m.137357 type:complete len:90 (+) Transcript_86543:91-360(+)